MVLNFVCIATNVYIDYWNDLIDSINCAFEDHENVKIHVFTDEAEAAIRITKIYSDLDIKVYQIPSLGWPDATFARYEIVARVAEVSQGIIAYIDADMLILGDIQSTLINEAKYEKMVLVQHPGYWRPKGMELIKLYSRNVKILLKDSYHLLFFGGIGSWETRRISSAHVPRKKRDKYYCGGFWFGLREQVILFCEDQVKSVALDKENCVVAKWHDESHLNKWASLNDFRTLSPEFCYSKNTPSIQSLNPKVIAVEKVVRTR